MEGKDDNIHQVNQYKGLEGGGDKIEVANEEASTATEEVLLQNNDIALSAIHDALNERTFKQIKNIEMAHEAWRSWKNPLRALKP